jgi:copper resistance protein B
MKTNARLFLLGVLALPVAQAYEPAGTPEDWPSPIPDQQSYGMLLVDRFEAGYSDNVDTYVWDAQGWYGGDFNRFWFKTEGEGRQGDSPESAELQALFSRKFSPFWDWQIGVRHDFRPGPTRSHAVIGLQGLMPYKFEWDSALFISEEGDLTARLEAEYDLRVTQRLIVQPRLELNVAASAAPELGLGSGINSSELGVRLRYEIRRQFAPFIGVTWEKRFGDTAHFAEAAGENISNTFIVMGVRAWF